MSKNIRASTSTIDIVHEKVHNGEFFTCGHYSSSLADAASLILHIKTGDISPHMIFTTSVGGACTSIIYEDSVLSNNGTSLNPVNHNRNYSSTPTVAMFHTPTVTSQGTQLDGTIHIPGTSGGGVGQGTVGSSANGFVGEMILKRNTSYLFYVTNVSGGAIKISSRVEWYEPGL